MSKKNRARNKKAQQTSAPASDSGWAVSRNWIIGLILGLAFLAFSNTLANGFAYDDLTFILQNQIIRSDSVGDAIAKIPTVFTSELWFYRAMQNKDPKKDNGPTTPYYRPMFTIFQMACWQLFSDKPGG